MGKRKNIDGLIATPTQDNLGKHKGTHFGSWNKSIQFTYVCFLIDHQKMTSKPKVTSFSTLLTFQTQTLAQSEARITEPKCALFSYDTMHWKNVKL